MQEGEAAPFSRLAAEPLELEFIPRRSSGLWFTPMLAP